MLLDRPLYHTFDSIATCDACSPLTSGSKMGHMEGVGAMPKTTTGVERGADLEEYLALVRAFPLAHIRDDAHLDAAVAVIDRLLDQEERSAAEETYLDALTDLVETYEEA